MVSNPANWIEELVRLKCNQLTFHYEAVDDALSVAKEIKEAGLRVGLAVKPKTLVDDKVIEVLQSGIIDLFLVMTVGYKIKRARVRWSVFYGGNVS